MSDRHPAEVMITQMQAINPYTQPSNAAEVRVVWKVGVAAVSGEEFVTVEGSGLTLKLRAPEAYMLARAIIAATGSEK